MFYWLLVIALTIALWLAWIALRRAMFRRELDAARSGLVANRAAYQQQFFTVAAASGKPRGLRWKECRFEDAPPVLARDRASDELIALLGATISFEAIEGGGMEDVEAVGNLRCATAVFTWNGRQWTTQGRAVFNLEPREVLERYADTLAPISTEDGN